MLVCDPNPLDEKRSSLLGVWWCSVHTSNTDTWRSARRPLPLESFCCQRESKDVPKSMFQASGLVALGGIWGVQYVLASAYTNCSSLRPYTAQACLPPLYIWYVLAHKKGLALPFSDVVGSCGVGGELCCWWFRTIRTWGRTGCVVAWLGCAWQRFRRKLSCGSRLPVWCSEKQRRQPPPLISTKVRPLGNARWNRYTSKYLFFCRNNWNLTLRFSVERKSFWGWRFELELHLICFRQSWETWGGW